MSIYEHCRSIYVSLFLRVILVPTPNISCFSLYLSGIFFSRNNIFQNLKNNLERKEKEYKDGNTKNRDEHTQKTDIVAPTTPPYTILESAKLGDHNGIVTCFSKNFSTKMCRQALLNRKGLKKNRNRSTEISRTSDTTPTRLHTYAKLPT